MRAEQAPLETADMDKPLIEIDLIPAEGDELGHPEPVPVGQQDHRVIPEPVPAHTPGRLAQASDFGGSQVLAGADVGVFMTLECGIDYLHTEERRVAGIHCVNSWSSSAAHSSKRCSAPSYRTSCLGSRAQS